jgi:GAF domain-containing protein/HAMP domain-containing protein
MPFSASAPPTQLTPAARKVIFWGATLLALSLVLATFIYLHLTLQTRLLTLLMAAGAQMVFAILAGLGAELIRQNHSGWGTGLVSFSLLGSLVVLGMAFSGLGPAIVLINIVAIPALAVQLLPKAQADRATRAGLLAGLITGLVTLFPPLPPSSTPDLQPIIPGLLALAIVPYLILVVREYRTYQLRAKLILAFIVVALVPLSLLAFFNERFTRETLTQAAGQALFSAARQTAAALDGFFNEQRANLQTQANLPVWQDLLNLAPTERLFSAEQRAANQAATIITERSLPLLSLMVVDTRGLVIAPNLDPAFGQDVRDEEFFRVPFENSQVYLSPITFAGCHPDGSLYIGVPILNASGVPVGVLIGCYDTRLTLRDILAKSTGLTGDESSAAVFDENQVVIAHGTDPEARLSLAGPLAPETIARLQTESRLPADFVARPLSPQNDLINGLLLGDVRSIFVITANESPLRVAVVRLTQQPWQVAFFQPEEVFLQPIQIQTSRTILLAVLMTGLMALAALGMAQLLSNPIVRLTHVASTVAEGNLDSQALVETGDEIGALATAFNRMTGRLNEMVSTLGQRVAERTAQLQAVADIGRAATSIRDLNQLLPMVLELIRERFGFYHASIFLVDEAGEVAILRESTGEAGRQLKARNHRLAVGSRSLVGTATAKRRPVVVQDVTNDPTHFKNPLLPDTRGEAVIPLISGERLVGALDVQSTQPDAFTESEVQILQTLADQLSVAIENAASFQRTQATLTEVSALYQQVVGSGLRGLTQGQENVYDLNPGVTLGNGEQSTIRLPLKLSDRIVGEIELQGLAWATVSAEEQAVLDAVTAQLAVALESAALLEETQRRSRREQLINQITSQMRATLNPDAVLQSGIRELGRALGATEVVVRLTPPSTLSENAESVAAAEATKLPEVKS